jgi:(p)ppGpp synthase/HD superfamily hydrolase
MAIKKHELEKMNAMLENGSTIAEIAKKYSQYDYWEIYWEVSDFSFLGKKRSITNRLNKLVSNKNRNEREEIAKEAKDLLDELYKQLKINSKKLIEIDHILRNKGA